MPDPTEDDPPTLDYFTPGLPSRWRRGFLWFGVVAFILLLGIWFLRPINPGRLRDTAYRVDSASNLRQIGQAMLQYSYDHNGRYPDSFETILLNEDVSSGIFVSPSSNDTAATGATTQAAADQLNAGGHLSYVYLGKGLSIGVSPDTALAYEKLIDSNGGRNVLFGDGHVEWLNAQDAAKAIGRTAAATSPAITP